MENKWHQNPWARTGMGFVVGFFVVVWWLCFISHFDTGRVTAFFTGLLALATFIAATAIAASFAQVREAKRALRDNRAWNRMNAAITFMPRPDHFYRWERALERTFVRLISRNTPLSSDDLELLFQPENAQVEFLLRAYLNVLESYSIAVNCGIADFAIAKRTWGYKVSRHLNELWPYIEYCRHTANNHDIYTELEQFCDKLSPKRPDPGPAYPDES
ncbi:MAG TPA: DUF4760 domain-containing protein [Terriglobales bacterium]|nr:DUF4760 domain-containing protein [Terriglobales bacterium]